MYKLKNGFRNTYCNTAITITRFLIEGVVKGYRPCEWFVYKDTHWLATK